MSGKRRRSETSWDMKQDKIPPPESNDSRRPSWEGNRKVPRNDDIRRDNKHRNFDDEWGKQHTTYRDRSRSPIQSRSRSRGREWESRRSPFYDDRHKSNDYGDDVRNNARCDNMKESWRHRSDHLSGGSRYSRFPHHKDDRNHDDDDDDDDRCRSNRVTKIPCKFFAVGKCYRDNCKFSHDASASDSQDYDRRSHENIRAHKNRTWHHDHDQHPHASDLYEKKKSWESGGFDENKKTTWEWDSHDKKKSWDNDDASNPNLDNKNRSWNGPSWDDDHEKTKSKSWNGPLWDDSGLNKKSCEKNDYFLPKQHNVANDSHINNENIVSEEEPNKQILTSVEEQVENGKSPKKKQEVIGNLAENAQQEQEHINTEKVEKGSIGNDEKSTQQCREIDPNRSSRDDDGEKSSGYGNDVRSNSGGDNLKKESWSHRQDYSRSSSHNRNSRNHYDDDEARNYDRRSHDNPRAHNKMTWHDDDLKASDLSEKNKSSWNGPTWDDVESGGLNENKKTTWDSHNFDNKKKSTTRDDMSNPNLDNKNRSWGDVESGGFNENKKTTWESQNCDDKRKPTTRDDMSNVNLDNKNKNGSWNGPSWNEVDASKSNAKSGNNIDEKSKSWVKMDNNNNNKKMRNEKGFDHFLPQQHNVVNDSDLNNDNIVSEEPNQQIVTTEQNLTNAIDYLKSLPNSTTHNQEGNIGNNNVMEIENGKTPKKKQEELVGKRKAKQEEEHVNDEKGKEGNNGNDEKCMRQFRAALVEFVKEILKPKWKEGRMTREVYKSVVKKVIDKITTTIQQVQIPKTQPKIELYLTHSKPKITKLVEAYVEKLVKA
ncbi:unnamed protein product [Lactuca virosa]|uniref:C3H1-type domain-containing protein n=1 Tax=Lactuca virosa TaxID=75947 RepID=A0AAU9MDK7_9ASTR|nr:unnamed protein product [Lactuca virosa]